MKQIHTFVVALLGASFIPVVCLSADTKEPSGLPVCAQPLGTLQVEPVTCDTLSCQPKAAAPHRGFGLGGFAMKAVDSKKLAVTPAALERSKDDLTQMLREAFVKTGCFTEAVALADEKTKSDFQLEARIAELSVKSTKSRFGNSTGQAVTLGIDLQLGRSSQPDSEKVSVEANSDKPTMELRHHAQLLHKSGDATALDLAIADVAIQAVTETTKRFSGGAAAAQQAPTKK